MQEALQEEKVIEKLREKNYEPNIYIFGMAEPTVSIATAALFGIFAGNQPKPFILNFTEKGIAFLELNSMCSKYTDLHNFIAADQIEKLSFDKGMIINTLTILATDGNKQKIKISNITAGAKWQKNNVKKMMEFLSVYKK
jgi:hypothetical protein